MEPVESKPAGLNRYLLLVGIGFVIMGLLNPAKGVGLLPLQFVMKKELRFTPLDMASFFSIAGIGWYLKPVASLLTDHFPIGGYRREPYMLIGALSVAVLWIFIGFGPREYWTLLASVTLLTSMFVICQAPISALVVEGGRRFAATGRLSTSRRVADFVALLMVGPLGGILAVYPLKYCGTVCGVMALLLALAIVRFSAPEPDHLARESRAELRASIRQMLATRSMWMASLMFFLLSISPGFQTPLFFYKTNTLHFSPRYIGFLSLVSASFSIVGSAVYVWACRRKDLRFLLSVAIVLDALGQSMFVFYVSPRSALVIEAVAGLMRSFVWMPILDLLVRAVPKGNEAIGAALEWSPANISVALSDILGSWLYQRHGIGFRSLAWIDGATTLLILFVVPLIPRSITDTREGQFAGTPSAATAP